MKPNKLALILVLSLALALVVGLASAQDYTEQDAINLALTIPEFGDALQERDDWYAHAYDTENRWGVWRVQFYNENGDDMGFADVSLKTETIYVYESYFGATDAQKQNAQPIIEEFLRNEARVVELMDGQTDNGMYIDYDGYNDWWGIYVDYGDDSLYITVRFAEATPTSLENPQIMRIYFANIKSYDEWYGATSQQAIVVAFTDNRVGDALAGKAGWTTETERLDTHTWQVTFWLDNAVVIKAQVNLQDDSVLNVE
jgi:hypothetical protein